MPEWNFVIPRGSTGGNETLEITANMPKLERATVERQRNTVHMSRRFRSYPQLKVVVGKADDRGPGAVVLVAGTPRQIEPFRPSRASIGQEDDSSDSRFIPKFDVPLPTVMKKIERIADQDKGVGSRMTNRIGHGRPQFALYD